VVSRTAPPKTLTNIEHCPNVVPTSTDDLIDMRRSRRFTLFAIGAVVALVAGLAGVQSSLAVAGQAANPAGGPPNIVFVLTDDLSWNLVQYMPQVQKLQSQGLTFNNYVVTDSLCCPSRASIFTGQFPHNTKVFDNSPKDGGFATFHDRGEEAHTFATALQAKGYRTGFMGKYLNGYLPAGTPGGTQSYVPPGWDEWDVAGDGYPEFDYDLNENHKIVHYGTDPADYLTDVLSRKGEAFIKQSAAANKPFLLEVATFAPHAPYTPAPRDADAFPGLTAPRGPAYDTLPTNPPKWLASRTPMTAAQKNKDDAQFRLRAQAVQAVDRLIATLRAALTTAGLADKTYVVFSSDNGFHMGEYRLVAGKMTAFDTDVRVPLVVAGPSIGRGTTSTAAVANIDLAPTFEAIGGAPVPSAVDGHDMLPLLHGASGARWRTANLIEHHGPDITSDDPDLPAPGSGNPPSYEALRTNSDTYVEYVDGSREYYDLTRDPLELHNTVDTLSPARLGQLHAALTQLANCHNGPACWTAGHI
jgi:N-acetylglucosamine-6-sulfatase